MVQYSINNTIAQCITVQYKTAVHNNIVIHGYHQQGYKSHSKYLGIQSIGIKITVGTWTFTQQV